MTQDAERIASGLTKAQQEALVSGHSRKVGMYPERTELTANARSWPSMMKAGLIYMAHGLIFRGGKPDRACLTPLGLAVRAHLTKDTDHDTDA